ncbi:MAG TPA: SUMF1/EgtB/PvdO family nonheme iron enzyme [Pyrinomonadaceae bacterium]|jgi:serine/threonine-protein kinase
MKECPSCNSCFDDWDNLCPNDRQPLQFSFECETILGGRYLLERRLGKGGMGTVFKAKHKFIKTLHAIKIISPEVVKLDETILLRFHQEAVLAASIRHPNVVTVTDYGVENNIPYLVMEFIDGISLTDYLQIEKRLAPEKAYEILSQIALGLGEAHKKGIVHRDLKPLNVMLKNGNPQNKGVKVLDFGLAKIKASESYASLIQAKTTNVLGSPLYMSPEQWSNENIDHRADIYSIGVMLFQMLAGEPPFTGETLVSLMYKHLQNAPPSFASLGVSVPPEIEAVVQRTLAKEREQRPATVEQLLSEYEQALSKLGLIPENESDFISSDPIFNIGNPISKNETGLKSGSDSSYIQSLLSPSENQAINTFLNLPNTIDLEGKENLAEEFIQAQNRLEDARYQENQAEKLAQEFAAAQRTAEEARRKAVEAQQKLEEDARRRIHSEMESKLAAEREGREKAEAEARRLLEEVKVRKEAEEKAKASVQAALEAQQRAEEERRKAEKEAEQRQIEERTRRKAEDAALKLAEEAAEAKRNYEAAKREAEAEAYRRLEAERKHQKIEAEIKRNEEYEAEQKRIIEAQVKEQAARLEKQALEAERKANEARLLIENEAKKRQEAEAARIRAEEAALKLAGEAAEAKRQYEEAKKEAESEAYRRVEAEQKRQKIEEQIKRNDDYVAEQRKIAEAKAAQEIKEQVGRLEKQAFDAERQANEARLLVENEAKKRLEAESARIKAEEEARRLAEEIIEAQKRLEEMQRFAASESRKREQEEEARKKAENSARSLIERVKQEAANKESGNSAQSGNDIPRENSFKEWQNHTPTQVSASTSANILDTNPIPNRSRRKSTPLYAGILIFIVAASIGGFMLFKPATEPLNNNNAGESNAGQKIGTRDEQGLSTNSANLAGLRVKNKMIKITGGAFQMGRDDVSPDEGQFYGAQFPAHPVNIGDFYLDKTEVTNEEYAEFVAATNHAAPDNWRNGKLAEEQKKLPVTNVTFFDARDFADWVSKRDNIPCRLPTEQEWEYAARSGAQQNIYPWGSEWFADRVNIATGVLKEVGASGDVTNVGELKDMMGNVIEWTSTPFAYYPNFPENSKDSRYKNSGKFTLRGLSFSKEGSSLKKINLNLTYRQPASGGVKQNYIGFRLACNSK